MNISEIKKIAVPILKQNGVSRASIFGSVASNNHHKNSDIDLLVDLDKGKSMIEFVALKLELENALNNKVDLVEYNYIKPALKDFILTNVVEIL